MASSDLEFLPDSNPSDGGNLPEQDRERSTSPVVSRELNVLGVPDCDCLDRYKRGFKRVGSFGGPFQSYERNDPTHFHNERSENDIRDPFYLPDQRNEDPFQANERNENVWEDKFSDPFHFPSQWNVKDSGDPLHFSQQGNEGAVQPDQRNENVNQYVYKPEAIDEGYVEVPVENYTEDLIEIEDDSYVKISFKNNNERSQLPSTGQRSLPVGTIHKNLREVKGDPLVSTPLQTRKKRSQLPSKDHPSSIISNSKDHPSSIISNSKDHPSSIISNSKDHPSSIISNSKDDDSEVFSNSKHHRSPFMSDFFAKYKGYAEYEVYRPPGENPLPKNSAFPEFHTCGRNKLSNPGALPDCHECLRSQFPSNRKDRRRYSK